MKKLKWGVCLSVVFIFSAAVAMAAYHHEGENDAGKFLEAYPDKAGTKKGQPCRKVLAHRAGISLVRPNPPLCAPPAHYSPSPP